MRPWMWVLLVVVVLAIVAVTVLAAERRRRRTAELQRQFGPEYERAVQSGHDRRTAEAQLAARARKRESLHVVPLAEPARMRYAEQWRALQEEFVDRPGETVSGAETLVRRVMEDRGYPVSSFEEQADLVSVDHPDVVDHYRIAHGISTRNASHQASTEDLREAMLRYRALFDELLRADQGQAAASDADHLPKHRADADRDLDLTAEAHRDGPRDLDLTSGQDARTTADEEGRPGAHAARENGR